MKLIQKLKNDLAPSKDYIFDSCSINHCQIEIIYNEILTSSQTIHKIVGDILPKLSKKQLNNLDYYLPIPNIKVITEKDILFYLNNGFLILIYKKIYALETPANLTRSIPTIASELSLSGPKDSFTELLNTNMGLLRRRIKSKDLKSEEKIIGRYTKTKVEILYIDTIVKRDLVEHVKENLSKIDIDGILDSSYLKYSLEKKFHLFPTIVMTERPDKCSMALLEGKVVVLVDTSPYALILPNFFLDCFHTTDDYFQKSIHTSFIRIIRLLAFFIAIFTPAIYLAVTTRNYNLVPFRLLLMLKAGRSFVPFPAYIEALFMIICFEILKESDLRMSTTSGSAVSILGGLILGDAAVAAGIVSPIMIIVIAISSIAGLIFSSIELENTIRAYKILLLIFATFFGIMGVLAGTGFMLYQLFSTEIFGYRYFSFRSELVDSIIKVDSNPKKRNKQLTNNIIRGRYQ